MKKKYIYMNVLMHIDKVWKITQNTYVSRFVKCVGL